MTNHEQTGLGWPAHTPEGRARIQALEVLAKRSATATSVVSYRTRGDLLIMADDEDQAADAIDRLRDNEIKPYAWIKRTGHPQVSLSEIRNAPSAVADLNHFEGHLGQFLIRVTESDGVVNLAKLFGLQLETFDFVIDLCAQPCSVAEVKPPGYFAPTTAAERQQAFDQLPELLGEFDKPKYFSYDASICAHGASHIKGCTRCLDACPTDAIQSLVEAIEVDPYLCQGGGICASACPTGAITYQFPPASDLLENLRSALHRYFDAGGSSPWLMFVDDAEGLRIVSQSSQSLPEQVVPVEVEEVGSVGIEAWLSALCYGALGVSLAAAPGTPAKVRAELTHQLDIAHALLRGLGLDPSRIRLFELSTDRDWFSELQQLPGAPLVPATGFAAIKEKRTMLRLALDHLYDHAPESPESVALPLGSPFGELQVNHDRCTLCMACVSVCPASALADGGDEPKLRFNESNCVQCGICRTACPENAITLVARYNFDDASRLSLRTLHEETPFPCRRCGKPFTTEKMIKGIREKLAGHWMYANPEQQQRLEMCEDCRVEDLFAKEGGLEPYDKP